MLGTTNRDRVAERREATRREILEAAWRLAGEQGLTGFTLADVAALVGMRAPSLYSHFDSKMAIYDAMFGDAWTQFVEHARATIAALPREPRTRLRRIALDFFDFGVSDPPRYQLMNQRVIPGFVPSPEAYAPSLEVMGMFREVMAGMGVNKQADLDLCIAIVGGLVESQLANEPGGTRWRRLVPRAMEMYADELGL
jgi:AcrR family transcriptional regulator